MPADPVVYPADTLQFCGSVNRGYCIQASGPCEVHALLAVGERDKAERNLYKRQLDAVDAMLGPWEPVPEAPNSAVGRVQTIKNLLVDRARGERDRRQIARLTEGLAKFRAEYDHSQDECQGVCVVERYTVIADLDRFLAGEEDAGDG